MRRHSRRHLWHLGLFLLLVLALSLPMPPPQPQIRRDDRPITLIGDPKTVQTQDPRICVHTRVTDEVVEATIAETFTSVREMGAAQVVEFFPWAYVEYAPGAYNWKHPDRIIAQARHQGLRVLARLGYAPSWALPEGGETFNDPALFQQFSDQFADFVGKFVARYRGRIDHVIIWNEPNLGIEWLGANPDPERYAILLRKAYTAAHAANPDITVLGLALAPTTAPPGTPGAWNEVDFMAQLYELGVKDHFDALSAHLYGFTQAPDAPPSPDVLNFRRLELLLAVMARYEDADKPIYITEGGWNDHPHWANAVGPGQRISYTLDAYAYVAEHWPQVQALCWWAFRFPRPTASYPDYWTFVTQDFEPKPIYTALQDYAQGESNAAQP